MKARYQQFRPQGSPGSVNQNVPTLLRFAKEINEGDVIIARRGLTEAIGVGTVTGAYHYEPNRDEHFHVIDVDWDQDFQPRKIAGQFHMKTVMEVGLPTYEEVVQGKPNPPGPGEVPEDVAAVRDVVAANANVILYGPPGTGKTYLAKKAAKAMLSDHGVSTEDCYKHIHFVQFHPSYSYEDFIRGLTAETDQGQIRYRYKNGIFVRVAEHARGDDKPHVLIVDEINRGDIPRIFGELMYLLEYRGEKNAIELQYPDDSGDHRFWVPENLHVVGTMNTADRSIALLDTALRRRFRFMEIMPEPRIVDYVISEGNHVNLRAILETLNARIRAKGLREKQIGHSYFMGEGGVPIDSLDELIERFNTQILPLLQEYFIDDFAALQDVLGNEFVNVTKAEIRIHKEEAAFLDALKALLQDNEPEQD